MFFCISYMCCFVIKMLVTNCVWLKLPIYYCAFNNVLYFVRDLIKKLLAQDRTRRLGNMKNGTEDVKRHKWFKTIDWESVSEKKMIVCLSHF